MTNAILLSCGERERRVRGVVGVAVGAVQIIIECVRVGVCIDIVCVPMQISRGVRHRCAAPDVAHGEAVYCVRKLTASEVRSLIAQNASKSIGIALIIAILGSLFSLDRTLYAFAGSCVVWALLPSVRSRFSVYGKNGERCLSQDVDVRMLGF